MFPVRTQVAAVFKQLTNWKAKPKRRKRGTKKKKNKRNSKENLEIYFNNVNGLPVKDG